MEQENEQQRAYLFLVSMNPMMDRDHPDELMQVFAVDAFYEMKIAHKFATNDEAERYQETCLELHGRRDKDLEEDLEEDLESFDGIELRAKFNSELIGPCLIKTTVGFDGASMEEYLNSVDMAEASRIIREGGIGNNGKHKGRAFAPRSQRSSES